MARAVFGDRLAVAERFVELLAGEGAAWGLIGPREVDRLWDRHLINCAVLTELLPPQARIVDVGSGAGLPGLALVCRRGDLMVDLVESMQRRTEFLERCVLALELTASVRIVRGRAEDPAVLAQVGDADWVTARAVAPLDRLAGWCLPLLKVGGAVLALKGARAAEEVATHSAAIRRLGATIEGVVQCGVGLVNEPAVVVVIRKVSRPGERI